MKTKNENQTNQESPWDGAACSAWIPASHIDYYPECHSTTMKSVRLMVCVDGMETAQFARYVALCEEWFIDGSPSRWNVTHFAIIYMPNAKHTHHHERQG